jgi:hypothetical protein
MKSEQVSPKKVGSTIQIVTKKFNQQGLYPLKIEEFVHIQDKYFLENIVVPYLSSVYYGLIARGTKDYLGVYRTKQYLNMPEPIGNCICNQINANGDERIDHDEFIEFMAIALMGNLQQKMAIAFKCFDPENQEVITASEVKFILRHVPINQEERYGISFGFYDQEANLNRYQ